MNVTTTALLIIKHQTNKTSCVDDTTSRLIQYIGAFMYIYTIYPMLLLESLCGFVCVCVSRSFRLWQVMSCLLPQGIFLAFRGSHEVIKLFGILNIIAKHVKIPHLIEYFTLQEEEHLCLCTTLEQ